MAIKKKNMNKKAVKHVVVNYPVGDFLIRVKNAARANLKEVKVHKTKLIASVAEVLKRENFVREIEEDEGIITVYLSYFAKEPVLMDVKLVSRPGLRLYQTVDELEAYKGPEVLIVSTSKGVLSHKEAISKRVGGEVIAKLL